METEKELLDYLSRRENYIYGAGAYAKLLSKRLSRAGIHVKGHLVTEQKGNPEVVNHVKVQVASKFAAGSRKIADLTIVIAMARGEHEVFDLLLDLGFCNIVMVGQKIWQEMKILQSLEEKSEEQYFPEKKDPERIGQAYFLDMNYPAMEPGHCAVIEVSTGKALFRVPLYVDTQIQNAVEKTCSREAFEALYGRHVRLPYCQGRFLDGDLLRNEKIELYAMTSHLDKQKNVNDRRDSVIPIQVGAALTAMRREFLADNTKDHISWENRNYCECTGLYWVWKNTEGQKYVGLSHYRRRFQLDEAGIRYMLEKDLDAVVILPQFSPVPVAEYFRLFVSRHDWQFTKEAVQKYDAAYKQLWEYYEQSSFFIPCNMVIFRREWLERYCEFAFTVAAEVDGRYKEMRIVRQDRYIGYLFESLLSLFLIRYHEILNIAYADMEFIGHA